jgi:hypothetical protein
MRDMVERPEERLVPTAAEVERGGGRAEAVPVRVRLGPRGEPWVGGGGGGKGGGEEEEAEAGRVTEVECRGVGHG